MALSSYLTNNANAGVNEWLGDVDPAPSQSENWTKETAGGVETPVGLFADQLCQTGFLSTPQPLPPQTPLRTDLIITVPQIWYGGNGTNPATYQGCPVQVDTINNFIDHGSHTDIYTPVDNIAITGTLRAPLKDGVKDQVISHPIPIQNVRILTDRADVIVKGRVLRNLCAGSCFLSGEGDLADFQQS